MLYATNNVLGEVLGQLYVSKRFTPEAKEKAIEMIEQNVGKLYISKTKNDFIMVHAHLAIGAENSGKLVAKVKNEAKRLAGEQDKDFVIETINPVRINGVNQIGISA